MPTETNNSDNLVIDVVDEPVEKPEKVLFTTEQQVKIEEIIKRAQGRAAGAVRAELAATQAELAEEREKTNSKSSQGTAVEIERLKHAYDLKDRQLEAAKAENTNIHRANAIQSVISRIGFVDGDMIATLTEKSIKFDAPSGKFIVQNEHGSARLNNRFEPMSLDEYYAEYASQKPYLVRSDARGGAGSTAAGKSTLSSNGKYAVETIFGKKSSGSEAQKLFKENPAEYHRLKQVAKDNKLI